MTQTKQVVAYCRVSTLEQKKNGLGMDIQIRDVTSFAESQSLALDHVYPDKAESGAAENRRELKKLLRACKRGEIGVVIIPALDRLSRDVRIAENLFYQFRQLGVRVLIADMPFYNGDDRRDVLIRQIREAIAEENRKDIIEKLFKGRQERVRQGRPAGGTTPYGYRRERKQLVEHPDEAQVVRIILTMDDSGASGTEVAESLNASGFTRRNGTAWTRWQVLAVIRRKELYQEGKVQYGNVVGIDRRLVLIPEREAA